MKKFLLTALKFLLLVLLFAAAALGCYALTEYMHWPWWIGACLFGGFIGLIAGLLFLRKWFLRRRERKFVKRIIDQDDTAIAAAPSHERRRLEALQERWMEAVELLRHSELRKRGNPLYVLPWYMVFGESDSGKTTAVASSRLTHILTDVGPVPGVSATKNCDWWFFEEAVILDTAGRYAIPLDESRDKEEWERFLSLLVKYRRKEPLNGLIVTVPANRLLEGDDDALNEYGTSIRRRIDELMRVLGARFPVYVLVTKMDLVYGLSGLVDVLPEHARSQAMGLVNEADRDEPDDFVDKAVGSVTERLRELRLLLLDGSRFDPAFLLFSEELERLKPRLKAFAEGAFEDNPYQESPLFRGLFFSSGEQSGILQSEFLSGLSSLKQVGRRLPDTTRGFFLHDFFSKVLPRDRNLFTPLLEFLKWKLLTRNLGMAAWLLIMFLVVGMMSLSYLGNLRTLNEMYASFPKKPTYAEALDERLVQLASFRQRIRRMAELNADWWVPTMGLTVSHQAQDRMETLYSKDFKAQLLDPLDKQLNKAISGLNARSPEQLTSEYVDLLVWRIDLIEDRLSGGDAQSLRQYQLPTGKGLAAAVKEFEPDLITMLGDAYVSYLEWTDDREELQENQLLLKARLGKLLGLKGADFKWLVDWANDNPFLKAVTLRDFWGGPLVPLEHEVHILPAYTSAGRVMLQTFLKDMQEAMPDASGFEAKQVAFWQWYADQYYDAWFRFADRFIEGEGQLLTKDDYRDMAASMGTLDNPYIRLMERMKQEFMPLKKLVPQPAWVQQVMRYNVVVAQYRASKAKGMAEAAEKAEKSLRKLIADLGGTWAQDVQRHIEAAKKLDTYIVALGDIALYADTQEDAFKSASALYPGAKTKAGAAGAAQSASAKGGNKTPVETAKQSVASLKAVLGSKGRGDDMFWDLVAGPLDYIIYVVTMEASCELQNLWEGQVLAEIEHVPDNKLRETLFGKQGVVNKFVKGPAKPFLDRDAKGWHGRSWFGIPFPFTEALFPFLDEGARGAQEIQPEYKVTLSTIPTSVNTDAKEEPYATLLEVSCGSKQQTLANFNYAEEQVFDWKPDECGTTTLYIQFPGLELTRTYEGRLGFAKFLDDFRDGTRIFTPDDFPEAKKGLQGLGVTRIDVGYNFKGATPVVEILDIKPLNVPDTISDCWQR